MLRWKVVGNQGRQRDPPLRLKRSLLRETLTRSRPADTPGYNDAAPAGTSWPREQEGGIFECVPRCRSKGFSEQRDSGIFRPDRHLYLEPRLSILNGRKMPANDIESEAAHWLIRLEGDPSPETRAQFDAWLAADPRNHAAYTRLKETWNRADILRRLKPLDGEVDERVLDKFGAPATPSDAPKKPKKPLLTIATLLLFLAASIATWITLSRSAWQAYETGRGGLQRIVLADGSTAILNTDSRIRVRMNSKRREVVLERGEALFTVAHDTQRPFDVTAGGTVVQAVGTAFCVQLREQNQVDVIVTEGRVAVDPPDVSIADPTMANLMAGEMASVKAHRLNVQKIDDQQITHKLAWTQGKIWFDRATLAEAVAEFNRYNRKQLVIADRAIAGLYVSGGFEATDLDRFVAALSNFGVRALPPQEKAGESEPEAIRLVGTSNHN